MQFLVGRIRLDQIPSRSARFKFTLHGLNVLLIPPPPPRPFHYRPCRCDPPRLRPIRWSYHSLSFRRTPRQSGSSDDQHGSRQLLSNESPHRAKMNLRDHQSPSSKTEGSYQTLGVEQSEEPSMKTRRGRSPGFNKWISEKRSWTEQN